MAKKNVSDGNGEKPQAPHVSGAVPYQPKMKKAEMRSAANNHIGKRVKLADFRSTVVPLTPDERELLIGQASILLESLYAHLPLKRALHANDPIQALRLLRLRHELLDERAFQSALMDVFLGLRDLHTNYILPNGYRDKFAFLPFRVEEFYEPGGVEKKNVTQVRKYVVSWVSPVNTVASLKEGVVVTHWNGSPIDLAIARNGAREAGSNLDARRAQGVEALTVRWLGMSLPPDEDWVNLTYTDGTKTYESRFEWEVIDGDDTGALLAGFWAVGKALLGLDLKRLQLDRIRKLVFDPQAVRVESEAIKHRKKNSAKANGAPPRADTSSFPDVFPRFGVVNVGPDKFGYIRLRSFAPEANGSGDAVIMKVVNEFIRILRMLPQNGLILDVRGNGGGYINIGELILQTLTPKVITPEGFHFLATPITMALAKEKLNGLRLWEPTILQGLESGASFSQGFPLTDPVDCNSIGQIYQGPVILITDALCYSTTDIFSAGFQDHKIGTVLGCHSSTGAGGANVWNYSDLEEMALKPKNTFAPLPQGADMRVAARRCTRVGERAGTPVEDYGVAPDVRYYVTKRDVVEYNEDMIATAAEILKKQKSQSIQLKPDSAAPRQRFTVESSGVDRFDLLVNGRPALSEDVTGASMAITLAKAAAAGSVIAANGYAKDGLTVCTRVRV